MPANQESRYIAAVRTYCQFFRICKVYKTAIIKRYF